MNHNGVPLLLPILRRFEQFLKDSEMENDLSVKVSCFGTAENDNKSTELMLLSDCGPAVNDAHNLGKHQPKLARDAHECGKTVLTIVCMSSTRL